MLCFCQNFSSKDKKDFIDAKQYNVVKFCEIFICNYLVWIQKELQPKDDLYLGGFLAAYTFFTECDSSWWSDSDYIPYVVFWIWLSGPILALKFITGWLYNFDFLGFI